MNDQRRSPAWVPRQGMSYVLTATACIGPWEDDYSAVSFPSNVFGEEYTGWALLAVAPDQVEYLIQDRPVYPVHEYAVRFGLLEMEMWNEGLDTTEIENEFGHDCFTPGTDAHDKLKASLDA